MIIREMTGQEVGQVTALEANCFTMPWKRQDFEEIITNRNRIYLVAMEEDVLLGGCLLTDIVGEGEISNVAVYEKYRRKGVAYELLQELLRLGAARNLEAFTLEVRKQNEAARKLYQKLGFTEEGIRRNFYEKPVDDAVIMWKRLKNGETEC